MFFESLLFGKVLIPVSYAVFRRSSLRLLTQLKRMELMSVEQIAQYQFHRLKQLLSHSYNNVPFYKRRFDSIGAKPEDIRTFADYAQFPLLSRQDLRDNLEEIVATNFDRRSLILSSTGGSTGNPINYYHESRYCYEVSAASMWRAWSWAGMFPGDRHLYVWGGPREVRDAKKLSRKMQFTMLRRFFVDAFDLGPGKLSALAPALQRFGPRFIFGYTSSVTALANFLLNEDIQVKNVVSVMTTAERLLPEQRRAISQAFNCRVYDHYACRDVRSVASECSNGKLHVNTDLNVVEYIPLETIGINTLHQIVLTPLELYGFPLLRYVNEDCGIEDKPCDCNLPFPTMRLQGGRISDNFLLPDGRVVHGEYFTHLVYGFKGIKQFQFRQVTPQRILFRVVLENIQDHEQILTSIRDLIIEAEAYLCGQCVIELEVVDQIPLTSSGKYRFTISEVKNVTHAAYSHRSI